MSNNSVKRIEELPLKNKFQGAASTLVNDIEEVGRITKEAATEGLHHVQENMSEYLQKGQKKMMEVEKKVETQIQQYPLRALLIAAGVGLLIGFVVKKR